MIKKNLSPEQQKFEDLKKQYLIDTGELVRKEDTSELDGAEQFALWKKSKEAEKQKMAQLRDDAYFAYDPASGMTEEEFTQQYVQGGMRPSAKSVYNTPVSKGIGILRQNTGAAVSPNETRGILSKNPQLAPQGQQNGAPQCMGGTVWDGKNCVLSVKF